MIKEYKNSRFYPCPLAANGDWCGGIVALTGHLYECTRCHAEWTKDGDPLGYDYPNICVVPGCGKDRKARGLCNKHYTRQRTAERKTPCTT